MRNTLFVVTILSIALFSCGKSEQSTETAQSDRDKDIEHAQLATAVEVQDAATVVQESEQRVASAVTEEAEKAIAEPTAAAVPAESESVVDGEAVYRQACISCHMTGAAGAPKVGDAPAWQSRIAKGAESLVQSAIAGVPGTAMVAKGACNTCSDDDIRAAVEYMVAQSR